jgi:hypothetical protein
MPLSGPTIGLPFGSQARELLVAELVGSTAQRPARIVTFQ